MKAAIEYLKVYHEILTTNEPINRAEGNEDQANLEAENAKEVEAAIKLLEQSK